MITLPHLETDLTQACQLSCASCNHLVVPYRSLKGGPPATTPKQVESDLRHFTRVAHTQRWGALGGEPLLHHQIVDILHVVQDSGVADKMEVWSNGLLLPKMRPEFWRAFDILVVSVYPGKHTDQSLDWIRKKCEDERVELVLKDERHHPNWTQLLETTPTDPAATASKFARCFFRHFSRVLNYGYFFTCCCGPHMPRLLQGQPFGTDGIPVEGLTEERLIEYLTRKKPLGACAICAGREAPGAVSVPWQEIREPQRWLEVSSGRAE